MTSLARRKRAKPSQHHSPAFWMLVGVGGAASALVIAGYLWRRAWGLNPTTPTAEAVSRQPSAVSSGSGSGLTPET